MAVPKRLPKSEKEKDFDRLMRSKKPSVWEDKGSVSDEGFRSLKKSAKARKSPDQDKVRQGEDSTPAAAGRRQSAEQFLDPDDIIIPPKTYLPTFDSFMREKPISKKVYGATMKVKEENAFATVPQVSRALAEQLPQWKGVSRMECGKVFGGNANTYGFGVSLARDEYNARSALARSNNMRAVKHLIAAANQKASMGIDDTETKLPPMNNGSKTYAKSVPGSIKLESPDEEGFELYRLHKPSKPRKKLPHQKHSAAAAAKAKDAEMQDEFAKVWARQAEGQAAPAGDRRRARH